ncbi:MAG TPA: hypothetical protein VNG35_03055 [Gemmatimonadales bacterium]|nr:hypothetical protein [Gemmatimonadales bacterium]
MPRISFVAATALAAALLPHPKRTIGGDPSVSPDGARIVFSSDRTGQSQLYTIKADGSGLRQLTSDSAGAYSGRWSPDGTRIVYCTKGAAEQIVVIRPDGQGRHVVIETPGAQSPSWRYDGSILFTAGVFPNLHIQTIDSTGTDRRAVMTDSGFNYDAAQSPDGKTIAFVRGIRGQGVRVYLMNADGSNQRRLTAGLDNEERPAWAPGGRSLAFQSSTRGSDSTQAYIYLVDVPSGRSRRLGVHNKVQLDETPSWFPDGKRLAIQSDRDGDWAVYVVDTEGTTAAPLTR